MDGYIFEDFISQLTKYIRDDLPERLKRHIEEFSIPISLDDEIQNYLQDNAIEKTELNYLVIRKIDAVSYDSLKKKKKYTIEKFAADDEKDYQSILQGTPVTAVKSPFSRANLRTITGTDDPVQEVNQKIKEYYQKALGKESLSFRSGPDNFVGLSDHPYFYVYEVYDELNKDGLKYLKLDLEEAITRLLLLEKYRNYVSYTPDIFGKGFFGAKAPNKRTAVKEDDGFSEKRSIVLKENVLYSAEKKEAGDVSLYVKSAKVLDELDKEIIDFIYGEALRTSANEVGRVHYKGNYIDICRILWPGKKSYTGKQYDLAKERLYNIFNTSVESSDRRKSIHSVRFFYDFDMDERFFVVDLGKRLVSQALTNRIQPVYKPVIDSLDNDISKVLYSRFKGDRIEQLFVQSNTSTYFADELNMIYHLEGRSKRDRIKLFKEAIETMVQKGILVKSLNVSNDCFEVTWNEFTPEERADIRQIKKDRPAIETFDLSDEDQEETIFKALEEAATSIGTK